MIRWSQRRSSGRALGWAAVVPAIVLGQSGFGLGAGADRKSVTPETADLAAVLAAVRAPGASAVLVNVWATWCGPCREEMPELIRFFRVNQARGLRLVLVSADDLDNRQEVARFLDQVGAAGARAFIKSGDDTAFVNGIDPAWSGALPASFLFDARGRKRRSWTGQVSFQDLKNGLDELWGSASGRAAKRAGKARGQP